jgi:hypothetical protein
MSVKYGNRSTAGPSGETEAGGHAGEGPAAVVIPGGPRRRRRKEHAEPLGALAEAGRRAVDRATRERRHPLGEVTGGLQCRDALQPVEGAGERPAREKDHHLERDQHRDQDDDAEVKEDVEEAVGDERRVDVDDDVGDLLAIMHDRVAAHVLAGGRRRQVRVDPLTRLEDDAARGDGDVGDLG